MPAQETWQEFASAAARHASKLHLSSVTGKMRGVHRCVRERHPAVHRIALALYDSESGLLKTFADSGTELDGCSCRLQDAPCLVEIAERGEAQVLDDLESKVTPALRRGGRPDGERYRSTLTLPLRQENRLLGFLFFDSHDSGAFPEQVVADLLPSGHLIGMIVIQELSAIQMLVGGLRLASEFAHVRDLETGAHLDRMARYARLIARELAPSHGLSDEYVEHVFLFAALHDIGKVGVPDRILLKPGRLDDEERELMREHVAVGVQMAERLIGEFGLANFANIDMLRNIVSAHHERMNGGGYPLGLAGAAIPLEARIVATADVFDAIVCSRSYKPAWTLDLAFEEIVRMSGDHLYPPAVTALVDCRPEVEAIYNRYQETPPH
ncbi:MAG: HD domain-containing protein [Aromatoleum sp.]|jgi:HD-GYP domain-containing protein (c-di-GMP phosphodiesterase class II)|uniref:HD-GYP domain-containing protein n=1 Tax=Aromatoleum sp. TaxID=2307007 RepID=UPI002895E61F|nr:HD domain-containing phosphohydrolase [Aromatoleum sp.]MDT3672205.1 HD domain-containing protein [Aromatoleum sp.]